MYKHTAPRAPLTMTYPRYALGPPKNRRPIHNPAPHKDPEKNPLQCAAAIVPLLATAHASHKGRSDMNSSSGAKNPGGGEASFLNNMTA